MAIDYNNLSQYPKEVQARLLPSGYEPYYTRDGQFTGMLRKIGGDPEDRDYYIQAPTLSSATEASNPISLAPSAAAMPVPTNDVAQHFGFPSGQAYADWMYGGQTGTVVPSLIPEKSSQQYYVPAEGATQVNQPLNYEVKDDLITQLMPYLIGGVGVAGVAGLLPGTTSAFGAAAGSAGAEAAAGGAGGSVAGGAEAVGGILPPGTAPAGFTGGAGAAVPGILPPGTPPPGWVASAGAGVPSVLPPGTPPDGFTSATGAGVPGALPPGVPGGSAPGVSPPVPSGSGGNTTFGIPNNILGGLAQGVVGTLGAKAQGDAYSDVASQYLALGAPGRAQYDTLTSPGYDVTQLPGLKSAMDTAAKTRLSALSMQHGNPANSPNSTYDLDKYLIGNIALPQYNTAVSQALTRAGLGVNTAGTGSLASAGQTGNAFNAIGAGLNTALNPSPSIMDLIDRINKGSGSTQNKLPVQIGGMTL